MWCPPSLRAWSSLAIPPFLLRKASNFRNCTIIPFYAINSTRALFIQSSASPIRETEEPVLYLLSTQEASKPVPSTALSSYSPTTASPPVRLRLPLPPHPPFLPALDASPSNPSFMPEPEAQLQATANLSPISPSPVHTAASQVVPALQDTVDTIDAMVAAAIGPNGMADFPNAVVDSAMDNGENDDVVDDDSFDDAYAEEETTIEPTAGPSQEQVDSNDDYAKTFDSPIGPEEGEGSEDVPQDVSSLPRESNDITLAPDHLTSRPADASHAAYEPSSALQGAGGLNAAHSEQVAQSLAQNTARSSDPQHRENQAASSDSTVQPAPSLSEPQDPSADIQQLVADLTSQAHEPISTLEPSVSNSAQPEAAAGPSSLPSSALPSSSTLPPRPPLPHSASNSYASQHHPPGSSASVTASVAPPTPGQPSTYVIAGAPGTTTDAMGSLLPPPGTALNAPAAVTSLNPPPYPSAAPGYSNEQPQDADFQHEWDQFMTDERQYMSEAKWDRFPEGSRIFIGNLSSDKVSKRDVFDLFHRFGRLAQISLKSAYGFVQYHTVDEGRRALENLQGIEIKGRRIRKSSQVFFSKPGEDSQLSDLEISRVQDKSKKDRGRSPDRDRGRGRDGGRRNEGNRHNQHNQQNRDDYRPGRNHSPRRSSDVHRDDGYGRDRGYYEAERGRRRSQSPGVRRNDNDSYRRRSPSPYGHSRSNSELDLPRRYGSDVPDVQIILQPDVNRDFVAWVEGAFKNKNLKTEVMYLHPRFPKEQVIQRQAAEGVHAVVDLDLRAQNLGRIPVQAFDRSAGISNVRFDQYVDLDPSTAAEVILRAKASGAAQYAQSYMAGNNYSQPPYGSQPPSRGTSYPPPQQPASYAPQQPPAAAAAEIANLIGQVDGATLQRLLASFQGSSSGVMPGAPTGHMHGGVNPGPSPANPQVDIQAILGSLNSNTPSQQPAASHPQYAAPYGNAQPPSHGAMPQAHGGTGDAAAQVQNIMAQLARYRQ
ncbi:LOW QUALITY PROTEIN: RNA-binding protein [Paramyrothecium foliicola]|nr:LOW QUALITY PROTEIN: RNA-binding protein [Paramyrothecium foliicola]